jgi:Rieske Fe-S protein
MQPRRHFLKVLSGAAAFAAFPACSDGTTSSSSSSGSSGSATGVKVADVPVGGLVNGPAGTLVGRDAGGVYAMSSICTHQSCDLQGNGTITAAGIKCACHGSEFDRNGAVLKGPAGAPLRHFQVTVSAGTISVNTSVSVDASTRTPV